jgi:hypothetical protein
MGKKHIVQRIFLVNRQSPDHHLDLSVKASQSIRAMLGNSQSLDAQIGNISPVHCPPRLAVGSEDSLALHEIKAAELSWRPSDSTAHEAPRTCRKYGRGQRRNAIIQSLSKVMGVKVSVDQILNLGIRRTKLFDAYFGVSVRRIMIQRLGRRTVGFSETRPPGRMIV